MGLSKNIVHIATHPGDIVRAGKLDPDNLVVSVSSLKSVEDPKTLKKLGIKDGVTAGASMTKSVANSLANKLANSIHK